MFDAVSTFAKQASSFSKAKSLYKIRWTPAKGLPEQTSEMTRAHVRLFRQALYAEVFCQVVSDPRGNIR